MHDSAKTPEPTAVDFNPISEIRSTKNQTQNLRGAEPQDLACSKKTCNLGQR
jgi:hypothetical protein